MEKDFDKILEELRAKISGRRIRHIIGVCHEAELLADKYGEDKEKILFAALLHDSTKEIDYISQLNLCKEWGIILDDDYGKCPQLLHAITGAKLAELRYGMPNDICGAIRYHSTGRAEMTMPEKIIYTADLTEQTRDFTDKLRELRELSYVDLDAAVAMSARETIGRETARGRYLHPKTIETYDYYKNCLIKHEKRK